MASQAMKSQGVALKRGNGATPEVFTTIGEITDITGPGGAASDIDVTHLQSVAKEVIIGLPDEGEVQLKLNMVPSDAQQTGLRNDRVAATLRNFKMILTDVGLETATFAGYVKTYSITVGVDKKIELSITIRVSGGITWS